MSLTTDDLQQIERLISKGFADGFQHLVIPYVDARIGELRDELIGRMDEQFGRVDKQFGRIDERFNQLERKLTNRMDEQFLCLNEKIDENTASIGHYFEQCVTKKEFAGHKKRIRKLELAGS